MGTSTECVVMTTQIHGESVIRPVSGTIILVRITRMTRVEDHSIDQVTSPGHY